MFHQFGDGAHLRPVCLVGLQRSDFGRERSALTSDLDEPHFPAPHSSPQASASFQNVSAFSGLAT